MEKGRKTSTLSLNRKLFRLALIMVILIFSSSLGGAWEGLSTPKLDLILIGPDSQLLPNTEYLFMVYSINEYETCPLGCSDKAIDQEINFTISNGEITEANNYSFSSSTFSVDKATFLKSGIIETKESNVGYVKLKTPSSGSITITLTGKEHDTDDYNYIVTNSTSESYNILNSVTNENEYFALLAEQRAETLSRFKGMYLDLIGLSGGSWDHYASQQIAKAMALSFQFSVEVGQSTNVNPTSATDASQGIYDVFTEEIPFISAPLKTFKSILDVGTGMLQKIINFNNYVYPYGRVDSRLDTLVTLYGQEATAWRNNDKQAIINTLDKEYAVLNGNPSDYNYFGGDSGYSLNTISLKYKFKAKTREEPGVFGLFYTIETYANKDATKTIPMIRSSANSIFNSIPNTPILYSPADNAVITTVTPTFTWNSFSDPDVGNTQSVFRIRIYENTGVNTAGTKLVLDKEYSSSSSQATPSSTDYINGGIVDGNNYHWHVEVKDNYNAWSGWANDASDSSNHMDFRVDTSVPPPENNPPNIPSNPIGPSSGYTGTSYPFSTSTTDSDGDNIYYTFDWGDGSTSRHPNSGAVTAGTEVSMSHSWSNAGLYTVKVNATDINEAPSGWSATTIEVTTLNPPNTPSNPSPSNGATNQPNNPILAWIGGDSDLGDTVTYNVYLDTNPNPSTPIYSGTLISHPISGLSYETTYYWQIVAIDNQGLFTLGPVWSFTTNSQPTAEITSITRTSTIQGQPVSFTGSGIDTDGTITGQNWRSDIDGQLNTSIAFTSSTLSVGTHTIYFKVKDNNDLWSNEASQTLTIDPDVTPPTITINSPLNNTVAGEYTLDISGVSYDISGVNQILINGNPVSTDYSAPGEVSFNTSIQLRIGDNEIIITAIDNYANSGDKTLNVKLIRGAIVEDPGTTTTTWTAENFGGFHNDIDDDTGTEMLMINPTASTSGDAAGLHAGYRTIDERELSYLTTVETKNFEYMSFGNYTAINFMGEPYFTGYDAIYHGAVNGLAVYIRDAAKEGDNLKSMSLLTGEGISKILIDSDDKYTVTTGDGIELKEGYVLNVQQVDVEGNKAYIELTKNGMVVDTAVVFPGMYVGQGDDVYVYDELNLGGKANVPTIIVRIDMVFGGADTGVVMIEGIFQISDTLTSVMLGNTYGNMEITDNGATDINMHNLVPFDLNQGSTVDIMGDIKFRVADDAAVLRFHPMLEVTEPGTYEIRGAVVADSGAVGIEWNPANFAGFYYDLDEDIGTETLTINSLSYGSSIDPNNLIYSTHAQDKQFAYENFGHYNVIGFMSDLYFVGYDAIAQDIGTPIIDASQNGASILAINFLLGQNISKILVDANDTYTVIGGDGFELKEGYVLNVSSIDMLNNDAILQLSKDGTVVDTKTVHSGGTYVYDKLNLGGENNVPTIIARIDTLFTDTGADSVAFNALFQISDTLTSVELGNTYGIMEITGGSSSSIRMVNVDNYMTLSQGSIKLVFGDVSFKTGIGSSVRFYPMIDYRIESPVYDTVLPTLTIISPTNGTTVYTSSIPITGTASDDTSIASITVNGILATGTTSWGINVPLTEGENTINVIATDIAGNTATETINVTYTIAGLVEIRGSGVENPGTTSTMWNVVNFAGFNYDLNYDTGAETLTLNPTESIDGSIMGLTGGYRIIDERELIYSTTSEAKAFKYMSFGNYAAINFMAEPYFTGYDATAHGASNGLANFVMYSSKEGHSLDHMNFLTGDGISKILIDSDDMYTVTTGDGIELKDGYVLNVRQVDVEGDKALLELTRYGNVVDTDIVFPGRVIGQEDDVYIYDELNIGDEEYVPTIIAGVKSVFRGTDTDMVTIEGIFQISDTLTSVGAGNTYGNMEVTRVTGASVGMNNLVPINLSQGSTVDIMGDIKFRVADDGTVLRFYPMLEVTESGIHEIRGAIATTVFEWNPVNFAGLYYDLDEDIGTETLTINSLYGRAIDQNELIYSTSTQDKQFAYENFGHYTLIGFMAQPYFAGYNAALRDLDVSIINASQNGIDVLDINFLDGQNLSRILIDTDDKYAVASGDGLELKDGYVLNVSSIDILNNNTIIKLSKNGTLVDTKTVSSGDVYVYDELDIGNENNVPIIIASVESISTGTGTDAVFFNGLFQISDTLTSVDVGDTYGNMKITDNTATSIVMRNNWRITLYAGLIKEIMGDIKFRVADDATVLRFYPFVDAVIEDSKGTGNITGDFSGDSTSIVSVLNSTASVGGTTISSIYIDVNDTSGLSGATIHLTFNASVVNVVSVANSDFDMLVPNIDNSFGIVTLVAAQTGSAGTSQGVIKFADVTLMAVGATSESSPLNLEVATIKNNDGTNTSYQISNGIFVIGINGDYSGDSATDAWDITYLARSIAGIPGYETLSSGDVSGDGAVDAWDITYLARAIAGIAGYNV